MLKFDTAVLIPVISGAISIIASILLSYLKNKSELRKIKTEVEQLYSKALFDKRIEVYPELYSLFSRYGKMIRYGQQNFENLRKFRDEVDEWNNKYSLFFTDPTSKLSSKFRNYLKELLSKDKPDLSERDWEDIRLMIRDFETFLRAEIGIFDTTPAGKVSKIEDAYNFISAKLAKLNQKEKVV